MRKPALIALFLFSSAAGAATLHWTGNSDQHWNNAGNWQEGVVPASGDTLVFDLSVLVRSMINDLPSGTVLAAANAGGTANFSVSGNMVELSGSTSGIQYNTDVRARGNITVTSSRVNGKFDVNGYTVTFVDSSATGGLFGTGALHCNNENSIGGTGTFSGPITAGDYLGELMVNGSHPSASLSTTALLAGDGTIGPVAIGFDMVAGLHTGNFSTLPPGAHPARYFVIVSNGAYRITHVNGTVTFGTILLNVSFDSSFTLTPGHEYVIFENDGTDAISGIFSSLPEGSLVQYGGYHFRITYKGGDGNDVALIAAAAPTVTITSPSPDPTIYGQPVTIHATASGAQGTPAGTITFKVNSSVQTITKTVALANGQASITFNDIAAATATISAHYSGDGTYSATDSNTLPHTVNKAGTKMTLRSSNNPSEPGEPVTFTVDVQLVPASTVVPDLGIVELRIDNVPASGQILGHGVATYTTATLASGTHTITATYDPNPPLMPWYNSFDGCSSSLTQQVREPGPPVITPHPESVFEGESGTSNANVLVTLTQASQLPVTVSYATFDGTATAPSDYIATSGTLTFAPGETSKTIAIAIIGDTTPEPEEYLTVRFSDPQNAMLGASSVPVSIINDDPFYKTTRGVEFASPAGQSLTADVYVPVGDGPFPAIVGINGDELWQPQTSNVLALREASRGYVVAMLSFRSPMSAPFPAQINDVKAGVRWLRANAARFSVDPGRIAVLGIGSGAHLAELLGTTKDGVLDDPSEGNAAFSSRVRAVAALFGASDLSRLASDPASCASSAAITQLLGCAAESCPQKAAAASPITYAAGGDDASFLLIYRTDDCVVPASQGQLFYDALHAAGDDANLLLIAGPPPEAPLDAFFDRTTKAPSRSHGVRR